MPKETFSEKLREFLGRETLSLTEDQEYALGQFMKFYRSKEEKCAFVLTGSAGTGKTFLIDIFTELLRRVGFRIVLLAPTGRAAKVVTARTNRTAFTIHHRMYSVNDAGGMVSFELRKNKDPERTVYIVDEASMIGDKADETTSQGLLFGLLNFVYSNNTARKLILVGDPVQLPPIGHKNSPALDTDYLSTKCGLDVFHAHLSEVKRQALDSGVLENAISIRDAYLSEEALMPELTEGYDVMSLENGYEGIETYTSYFEQGNLDQVIFITYSNFRATKISQALRYALYESEELLIPGDLLMVVKNNYNWGKKNFPFIANGEMGILQEIVEDSYEEKYGLKWLDVVIEFQNGKGEGIPISCKVMLDLLLDKRPQLDNRTQWLLLQQRRREYMDASPSEQRELLQSDPYVHALQVKYGYAVTGHKAQGGQWKNVIIGFEPNYSNDLNAYLRWTYTVFTRAEERVFMLECPFIERF